MRKIISLILVAAMLLPMAALAATGDVTVMTQDNMLDFSYYGRRDGLGSRLYMLANDNEYKQIIIYITPGSPEVKPSM